MLGFPGVLAEELGAALKGAGCLSINLDANGGDPGDPSKACDIQLVWAGQDGSTSRAAELVATSQRWLLVGPEERIRQNTSLYLWADDVVFTPYSLNELLFRVHRAMHGWRAMHRADAGKRNSPARQKPVVLVADDDPSILMLLESVMPSSEWDCHFATDGRLALFMAQKLLPAVLVLDIEMPFMTGLEVLRRIRRDKETQKLKVLLLTACNELKDVQNGLSLGADGYLSKPCSHLTLLGRVRALLVSPAAVGLR